MKRMLKGSLAIVSAAVIFAGSMPYTAVNVSADSNETEEVLSNDNDDYTDTWGTCKWKYDNGTLTISGGVANDSILWKNYKSIEKIVITGKITFEKEISLSGLFSGMTLLKTIEGLDNLDTSKVTSMGGMFNNCSSLTMLDVSNFDTSKVTNMDFMFYNCESLTTLDVSNFDTNKVTKMAGMFYNCRSLTTLDVSNFDTSKVTNMGGMFNNCRSLTMLDVSNFDTSKVTNMGNMFLYCRLLTTLDVSNFDTSKVTSMDSMFYKCESLATIDVSKFDTSKVTNMRSMFYGCISLTTLDLFNFDFSNVAKMKDAFIKDNIISVKMPAEFGENGEELSKELKNGMSVGKWTDETTGIIYDNVASVELLEGHSYKFISNNNDDYTDTWGTCKWKYDNGTLTISGGVANDSIFWNTNKSIEKIVITGKITFEKEISLSGLFSEMTLLKTIEGLDNLDTSKVTDMSYMFYNCSSLTMLDVSNFDTSKVTDMSYMFYNCRLLTTLDVSNFDTSKVINMVDMFYNCNSLTTLDVSKFNTSKVTNMGSMFYGCSKVQNIDVSNFDTSKVTDMVSMFYNCESLTAIDVSKFDTSKVTNMGSMFYGCILLTTLDLSNFDFSNVSVMKDAFKKDSIISVKMPAEFGGNGEEFSKELKNGMPAGKWTDETMGIIYDNVASVELLEGHSYKFNAEKMSVNLHIYSIGVGGVSLNPRISVQVQGGAPNYTYKYIMYNPMSHKWTLLSDYSTNNSYAIYNIKGSGERIIYVDVKDALGNVERASITVTLTEQAEQEPLTVEAFKNETDKQVTFTANAAGGSSGYTYKFIVYNKTTGIWGVVQDYSDKNTCTWTKGSDGDRDFYVDVEDSDGNVVRSQAMNVKLESDKPTAVLTPSASTVTAGDKLTLTASTNKSGCTYKFLIYNPSTNQWFKLQDFGSKNTYTWTAGSAGTRQFYVDVKDSDGNVTRSRVVNVTIGSSGALSVKTAVSASTTKVGDKITFTAEGAGGKAGYTYKMVVYNKTTKTWGLVQNFSSNNKITWTAGSAGDREFYIDVKDANGNVVRSSVMNVKTTN